MDLYADVHYPRDLIDDHLSGGFKVQLQILQSLETGEGQWGMIDGFRIITRKEWISDELDCFKLYPKPVHQF